MLTRVVAVNYLHLEKCTKRYYNAARYYGSIMKTLSEKKNNESINVVVILYFFQKPSVT